ncbi:hypothetical protein RFI_26917, partial [Reticulomyxa filosa]
NNNDNNNKDQRPSAMVKRHSKKKLQKEITIGLERLLRDDIGFNAFMKHCLKEFSSENVLCLVECVQYQQFALQQLWKEQETDSTIVYSSNGREEMFNRERVRVIVSFVRLWKGLPQSEIVFDPQLNIVDKAKKLIEKYIRPNAPFEEHAKKKKVNLGHGLRRRYNIPYQDNRFPAADDKSWALFFQPVIVELVNLMRDSHSRFLNTEEYKQLLLRRRMRKSEQNVGTPWVVSKSNTTFLEHSLFYLSPIELFVFDIFKTHKNRIIVKKMIAIVVQ